MKHSLSIVLVFHALACLVGSGCATHPQSTSQVSLEPAENSDALVDSMVNDRRTWVDPRARFAP